MVKLLAELFREVHYIIGISLPPPGTSDRRFVVLWLGSIAVVLAFSVIVFYIIIALHFRH